MKPANNLSPDRLSRRKVYVRQNRLPYGNDSIIAVIQTVAAPAHDSHISFYNRRWEKMSAPLFKAPDLDAWLTSDGDKDASNVAALIPFMLAKYAAVSATPSTAEKTVTYPSAPSSFPSSDT